MSTDDLLKILESRSLDVVVKADGTMALKGDKTLATPALLGVLKLPCHRDELLRRFKPAPPCPACGKGLDDKGRCWALKCGWRLCAGGCGKATGSPFIGHCDVCAFRLGVNGVWADD